MQPAAAFTRLPETLTPPEIGAEMARLRTAFSLTPQEVSERLHIRPRYITAIEEGKFELMPGKVYARGYVQSYAEFLGLDPVQILQLCFAQEGAVAAITQHLPPPSVRPTLQLDAGRFRGVGVVAVILLVLALVVSQWMGRADTTPTEETTVAPVPEDMLKTVRNLIMPTAQNIDCLTDDTLLACFFAQSTTREVMAMLRNPFAYGEAPDVSEVELVPLEAVSESESESELPPEGEADAALETLAVEGIND